MTINSSRIALSVEQIAKELNVQEPLIRKEIKLGKLGAIRVGRLYRVPTAEFERYLEVHTAAK